MSLSESATLELKREFVTGIVKTVIAFANTSGGTILIGVDDDGNVVGVDDTDGTQLRLSNSIRDSVRPDVTMFVDYHVNERDGKPIIEVAVQKGTASPYYLAGKGIRPEGVFVRQGASTVPATETAILRMIKETDGEKYEDVRSLVQELTFTEAAREFQARNLPFGTNQQRSLGLLNSGGVYTNLGLLLSDQCVHTVKVAVFEGREKTVFKDRREFSGSLLKQSKDAYEFIDRYNSVRSEIKGLHRLDRRDYPSEAIREALLNALAHRDYSFRDSTLIGIFDDRIEIITIGGLVKGISYDDIMLGVSVARNRNLANVFYRLSLIEAYGTGIPKILKSYSGSPVQPRIEVSSNAFKVTLPNTNFRDENAASERYEAVLSLLKDADSITRQDVESALSVSQPMAVRILKGLVDAGKIRVKGRGKNTRYTK
ncbi:MAG: RNA-binding domain-containing protein [Bacillota bacterium]